jgi:hypothetical protein
MSLFPSKKALDTSDSADWIRAGVSTKKQVPLVLFVVALFEAAVAPLAFCLHAAASNKNASLD